jgi:spermidine synthase
MLRTFGIAATVFGCGWILMGLEILGGRMLPSHFGSGVWVWGSVITVFLAALSAGYFVGGILSQRFPHSRGLALLILLAAASIVPVAVWHGPASRWFAELGLPERWGSLLAATAMFFLPSMLLGMVSPYAVRLVARDVESVGAQAGTLYAISTIGSCLGCLATSFYFILWWDIRQILLFSAAVLLLIAAGLLATWYAGQPQAGDGARARATALRRRVSAVAGLAALVVIVCVGLGLSAGAWVQTGPSPAAPPETGTTPSHRLAAVGQPGAGREVRVLLEKESQYHYLRVIETSGVRHLQFRRSGDDFEESAIDLANPLRLRMDYYPLMMAGLAYQPNPRNILFVGLGGGTIPMVLRHYYPQAEIDNVELDPEVAAAAKTYFGLEEDQRMKVYVRDGRLQVGDFARAKRRYDLVFLDAFRGGYVPHHLTTKEFLQTVQSILADGGAVVSNLLPNFESYHYQRRTIAEVFPNQWSYGSAGNVIVVADMRRRPLSKKALRATAERLQEEKEFTFDLPAIIDEGGIRDDYERKGPILTDDYAPTDVLRGIPKE